MICEKIHTQLLLENLEEKSADSQHPQGSSVPQGETESSGDARAKSKAAYQRRADKARASALKRYYERKGDTEYIARQHASSKRWRERNPERYKALKGDWYQRNRDRLLAEAKAEYVPHPLPVRSEEERKQRRAGSKRKFAEENREATRARHREEWKDPEVRRKWYEARNRRFKEKPEFLIKYRLRSRVSQALRGKGKSAKTMELIGCSVSEFRLHIEAQWKPGMDWSNLGAGAGTWQIDHINPVSNYDLTTPEGQRAAFHYLNTQPLWYEEHQRKSATEETGLRRNQRRDEGKASDSTTASTVDPAMPNAAPLPPAPLAPGN